MRNEFNKMKKQGKLSKKCLINYFIIIFAYLKQCTHTNTKNVVKTKKEIQEENCSH